MNAAREEGEDAAPGIDASCGVFAILNVEEAVGSAGIDDEIVDDAGEGESSIEERDVFFRNAVIGAAEEAEDGSGEFGGVLERACCAVRVRAECAVKTDDAGETETGSGGEEGLPAAEAETESEDGTADCFVGIAKELCGSKDVLVDGLARDAKDVLHVIKGFVSRSGSRGAAEIVDGEGGVALFGDVDGELFIEGMKAAYIGQDDDASAGRFLWSCQEGRKFRGVHRSEGDALRGNRGDWLRERGRCGIDVVAHVDASPNVDIGGPDAGQSGGTVPQQVRRQELMRSPLNIIP